MNARQSTSRVIGIVSCSQSTMHIVDINLCYTASMFVILYGFVLGLGNKGILCLKLHITKPHRPPHFN